MAEQCGGRHLKEHHTQELSKQIDSLLEMFYHLMHLFKEEAQSNRKNEEEIKELKIKVDLLTRLSCSKCSEDLRGTDNG